MVAVVTLFGGLAATLVALTIGSALIWFLWEVLRERDPGEAARKTSRKGVAVVGGAGAVSAGALFPWLELLWQLPELLIALWGGLAILQGFSVKVFLAVAFLIWVVSTALEGAYRASL